MTVSSIASSGASSAFSSVVELELEPGDLGWWQTEGPAVARVLDQHYGPGVGGHALTTPSDPAGLRAQLRTVAPQLAGLIARVRHAFDTQRACAVVIPRLGIAQEVVDDKRKAVFAFAALIGNPTANVPFEQVLWDVQHQGGDATRHTSFSENDQELTITPTTGNCGFRNGSSCSTWSARPAAVAGCR